MENKRGQLELYAIGIILLLGLIITAFLVWNTQFRYVVLGIGLSVMAFVVLFKANIKQKTKVTSFIILLGAGLVLVLSSGYLQSFNSTSDIISVNTYSKLKCELADSNALLYSAYNIKDSSSGTITCGKDMKGYTNRCTFKIQNPTFTNFFSLCSIDLKKCKSNGTCIDALSGVVSTSQYFDIFTSDLDTTGDGYITSEDNGYTTLKYKINSLCSDKTNIEVRGNVYVLEEDSSNGYRSTYVQGCNLNYLKPEMHLTEKITMNYQGSEQVPFGRTLLYVDGTTQVNSANLITKDGKQYYIQAVGYKIPVKTAIDGQKYANYQDQIADNSIQCLPANIYVCNKDATLKPTGSQEVVGSDCSAIRGIPNNVFVKRSNTECCTTSCVNNAIKYSNCETCATCKSDQVYNNERNECVKTIDTSVTPKSNNSNTCSFYQQAYTRTDVDYGFMYYRVWLDWVPFINPKTTEAPDCKNAGWFNTLMVVIVVGGLGSYAIYLASKKKRIKRK